jgi:hypothetical protein
MGVCFEIHTEHMNTVCGLKLEFGGLKPGGIYGDH